MISRLFGLLRDGSGDHPDKLPPFDAPGVAAVPSSDFINEQFDAPAVTEPQRILLVLSTQRSGSTYLSDLLRVCGFGLPHEYFQAGQYLHILNRRWQFANNEGWVDWLKFAGALQNGRTSETGWLSLNIHGFQLTRFERAFNHFPSLPIHAIHLKRAGLFEQALSLAEARQTGAWTKDFTPTSAYAYDKAQAIRALEDIVAQNTLIDAWLEEKGIEKSLVYYEDIAADPAQALAQIFDLEPSDIQSRLESQQLAVRKQAAADARKGATEKLRRDYLRSHGILVD